MHGFAGSLMLSILALYLDGNVLRSPAGGGGGAQGPNCFLPFCSRVLSVNFEGLSSNFWFVDARDGKGTHCNLYPPRVK
jgi:hypothetical protein